MNEQQKMTVRVAVGKAADKDSEIKKLAAGFKVPEADIRAYWESQSGTDLTNLGKNKKDRRVVLWSDAMVKQLNDLLGQGKGPTEIAKIMDLDMKRVQNKIRRLPDRQKTVSDMSQASQKPKVGTEPDKPTNDATPPKSGPSPSDPVQGERAPYSKIDIPKMLPFLMEMVCSLFRSRITQAYANDGEKVAECKFEIYGEHYCLRLEAEKCTQ